MDIVDLISQGQGGQNLGALARQFGLDESQTQAALEQLAPAVMAGIRRNTGSADGLSGLVGAIATGGHDRYLDTNDAGITADGNAILGHVFGSKDVSRSVASEAAGITGVDSGILKKMLPVIAAMVMGALTRKITGGQGAGGLGGILGQILGGGPSTGQAGAGSLGGILGQVLGGGGGGGGAGGGGGGLGGMLGGLLGGETAPSGQGSTGIGDILNSIFGGAASPEVREAATGRAAAVLGDALGQGTKTAAAGDELLDRATSRQPR